MAPKVHSKWLEHGWWIEVNGTEQPNLWITDFPIEEGRYWAPLGTLFGGIESLAGTTDGGLTVSITNTEKMYEKYKLKKKLMMAPIPPELLLVLSPIHGLKTLVKFWKMMPDELKIRREACIQKFKRSTPEQLFEARSIYMEIRSYEDLHKSNPTAAEERPPPREPEDTDDLYRLYAAPVKENWTPVSERNKKRVAVDEESVGHSDEGAASERQRAHRQRLVSSATNVVGEPSRENESERREEAFVQGSAPRIPTSMEVGGGEEAMQEEQRASQTITENEEVVVPRELSVSRTQVQGTVAEAGSGSRALGKRKYNSEVRMSKVNAGRSSSSRGRGVGRGRGGGRGLSRNESQHQSQMQDISEQEQTLETIERGNEEERSVRTRTAMQRHLQRVAMQGPLPEGNDGGQEADDNDSAEEESEQALTNVQLRSTGQPPVVFPTETEFKAGYIWGQDMVFDANIDNIRNVLNAETNHRTMMEWRVNEMYERLKGSEADEVSAITLRPVAYHFESTNEEGQTEVVQVSFSHEGAAREFEVAYLTHCQADPTTPRTAVMTQWLQSNIVWEPVDGQHIVGACKRAQQEHREGKMSEVEYLMRFAKRKAKFLVYNNPQFYIEASVRINAKEFERPFFSTYYENLIKLRDIWKACGSPSAVARVDDAYRSKALTMASSALHWSRNLPQRMSLGNLAKKMIDYTRHAWNENEEAYEAILQVCKDYEEGKLFFSKKSEDMWKKMAREQNEDVNCDGNPKRKRMEKTWLRPLSRVSNETYVRVVKRMAAKEVVDGRRPSQQYYFNSATSPNPPKGTVAYAVDRIQQKDSVRNQIRFLMVEAGDENPLSMDDFFAIDASRYAGEGGRQFTLMGKTLDGESKTLWYSPTMSTVQSLRSIDHLISAFVRQHFTDIRAGRRGFEGYDRDVEDVSNARWDWQVALSIMQEQEQEAIVHVRCRGGFFGDEYIEIGKPCLWIFDCRRGGSEGQDEEWSSEDYKKVVQQLLNWMSSIVRWTAIFLFPPGVYFDEAMQSMMAVPESCHCLKGSWIFEPQTVPTYVHDLHHGGQRQCGVQVVEDIAIIMEYPRESGPMENLPRSTNDLDVVFRDSWSVEMMPRAEDKLERTAMELKRMVQMYLPKKWGLVTLGITMAVPGILETGFNGNDIIIMEGASIRTQFVYSKLQLMYGEKMVMVNSERRTAERISLQVQNMGDESSGHGSPTRDTHVTRSRLGRVVQSSSGSSDGAERFRRTRRNRRKGKETAIDSGASSSSGGDRDAEEAHSDDLPSAGRSLGSADTNAVSEVHGQEVDMQEMEEDPDYAPTKNNNNVENVEVEDVGARTAEIGGTPIVMEVGVLGGGIQKAPNAEDVRVEGGEIEGTPAVVDAGVVAGQIQGSMTVTDVGVEGGEIDGASIAVDVQIEGGEVEGTLATAEPMSALSAFNSLVSDTLFSGEDGYFYDRDHMRYVRTRNEEPYVYERVVSVLEGPTLSPTLSEGVSTPSGSAVVHRALELTSSPPLTPIGGPDVFEEVEVVGRSDPEELTQSSERVLETPEE